MTPVPHLTPRQQQILSLVCLGHTNQQIASDLGLSVNTVKTYMRSTLQVLGVPNRAAAAALWTQKNREVSQTP